ncbi:MAG TPA: hypothetical protein VH186_05340 [Chloroflexia bacterium]|nr:hypothetical protein [Chloroflexia bacterium]
MKLFRALKSDQFLKTSIIWGLGILGLVMVFDFGMIQLDAYDPALESIIPFALVLFGGAYMVKFIGARPVLYTAICGLTVGYGMAFLGLLNELLKFEGIYYESFLRFLYVGTLRGAGLALAGALGGWIMTRGKVPIEIEVPSKKEEDEARLAGKPLPAPRIVTPVSAMPGSLEVNTALLAEVEKAHLNTNKKRRKRK